MSTNTNAIGIIFPNTYDEFVPQLTNDRLMASIPFAARYRLVDFVLSSMANSGIDNIAFLVNKNYHSLIDHLGAGREWDLVRKNGGLHIFPPFAMGSPKAYTGRVGIIAGILGYLRDQKTTEYVVMSDANIAYNIDFKKIIDTHIASGADITALYNEQKLPESAIASTDSSKGLYYTFKVEDGRIKGIKINDKDTGIKNFGMNVYVMKRELLIDLIDTAFVRGAERFERDVLIPELNKLNIQGYKYDGYVARICDMKSYFEESMKLLDDHNLDGLFAGSTIYTKVRDDNPTRYISGSDVKNTMVADGCVIEGEVENCILFRGVKIAKGAKVKNCIIMQDTVVEAGAELEYIITDKNVTITEGKKLQGSDSFPVYVAKFKIV